MNIPVSFQTKIDEDLYPKKVSTGSATADEGVLAENETSYQLMLPDKPSHCSTPIRYQSINQENCDNCIQECNIENICDQENCYCVKVGM